MVYLKKLLKQQQFDIVHQLSPFAWRYPSIAAGLGVPAVRGPVAGGLETPASLLSTLTAKNRCHHLLRETDSYRKYCDPILRSSYRKTDLVMVAAPYVLELMHPLNPKQTLLEAEHGIEEKLLNGGPPEKDGKSDIIKFLYVGRIVRTKGLRDTIRALAKISQLERLQLTIVGDGEDLSACKKEAQELGLEDKVLFLGWQTKDEVQQHYRDADIFICPTFREPVGAVFLEAMSHGLPSIICSYGGPSYLVDETCGILVPPSEESTFSEEIANAIDRLILDNELRSTLANGALKRASEYFSWAPKRKRMSKIYYELAARSNTQIR